MQSKAPVYIGDLAVVPRKDFKRLFELGWEDHSTDLQLKNWISELTEIPLASQISDLPNNTVILDILVSDYQYGSDAFMWSDPMIPLAWRPSVQLHGRLTKFKDKRIIGTFNTKKSLDWGEYFSCVFSITGLFSIKGPFGEEHMKYLLGQALIDLLKWAKKKSTI